MPHVHLLNAYALMTTSGQAANLVGPALAGLLLAPARPVAAFALDALAFLAVIVRALALSRTGGRAAFALDALAFLAVIVALALLRVPPLTGGGRRVSLGSVAEGLRFVWSRPIIAGLLGPDVAAMLFGHLIHRCCQSSPARCWARARPALACSRPRRRSVRWPAAG